MKESNIHKDCTGYPQTIHISKSDDEHLVLLSLDRGGSNLNGSVDESSHVLPEYPLLRAAGSRSQHRFHETKKEEWRPCAAFQNS